MDNPATTEPPPLVDVQTLRVRFGTFWAVNGVSLTLKGGDLLGLVGPNGAGKTTLLRAMAGLQPTAAGQVRVLGEVVEPGAAVLARVGFTPDTPPLYEEMTVGTFLRFIAKGYGLAADVDAHLSYWLERVGRAEKATQKIKSLSRGMRQRLGLARTLLPNPSVVLLDEPAAGLDPAGRVQFRKLLCELRDQGKALVVSSHILADMADYCTHIAVMERGVVRRFGTVADFTADAGADELSRDRRRYNVTLARVTPDLRDAVTAIAGVGAVEANGDKFTVEWGRTPEDATRLLAELMARGLPVASFAPEPADLEQAYLRAGVRQVD